MIAELIVFLLTAGYSRLPILCIVGDWWIFDLFPTMFFGGNDEFKIMKFRIIIIEYN